ncbi:peptidylprolyl isomerase [Paenibacillus sp. L3-i20]|uniref:peptidylprolyl isomerase n=1 Tax=Paenibacillus sp. L3-i20 TaxID=2905833 RepID=UPI001EDEBC48|nr:peptidylprolyl isomerase [Paenibacillus sp. L3-i20]GKU77048.1 hypothetical protein L3i20_v214450 [Paenibacillus sp. L3-i20]
MKRYEVLKVVVILQAVCMIALTGMVLAKVWPQSDKEENEQTEKLDPPPHQGDGVEDQGGADKWNNAKHGDQIVATVNGKPITRAQLSDELYKQYGNNVLRQMMVRLAIDLEVDASNIVLSQEELERELALLAEGYGSEDLYFAAMKDQLGMSKAQVMGEMRYRILMEKIAISNISISDSDVEEYMEAHPEQFDPKLQLHLLWIVTDTQAQAESLLEKLADGEDFAQLARDYSQDEFTADDGGDLGMIDADDPFYNDVMLKIANEMSIAEIEGPIALDEGFAIIQLAGRQTNSGPTGVHLYNAVRKKLALEQAKPLRELEDELLERYGAAILK